MTDEIIINWTCDCGFPYNDMDKTECGECGKAKPETAPVTEHRVVGRVVAESVSLLPTE